MTKSNFKEYMKRPSVIQAIQNTKENLEEIEDILQESEQVYEVYSDGSISISTLEGTMTASVDDYIIKGIKNEFYPCKPDIFEELHEAID